MRKIEWYCDRCNKLIDGTVHVLAVHYYDHEAFSDLLDEEEGAHLCKECFELVDGAIMETIYNLKPKEEEEPKKKAGGYGKLDLDLGKIAALRNAGWSFDKIGDELGVSGTTIRNKIDEAMEFLANKKRKGEQ